MRDQYKLLAEKYKQQIEAKSIANATLPANVEGGMRVKVVAGLEKIDVPVYEMWVQDGTLMIAIDEQVKG